VRRGWQAFGALVIATALAAPLAACDDAVETKGAAREVQRLKREDIEVFLTVRATPRQVATMRRMIQRSDAVERFTYVDRDDAIREFRRVFRDQPDLVATTKRSELPVSFRVKLHDPAHARGFRRALEDLAGFDETLDRRHPPGPPTKELMRRCAQLETKGSSDAEVFMNVLSSPDSQERVRNRLETAPEVGRFEFVSQQDALQHFRRLFADSPKLLASATADQLPASFRVWFRAGTAHGRLLSELEKMSDVDEVEVADPTLRRMCFAT
jgi:cell division protein FtsX